MVWTLLDLTVKAMHGRRILIFKNRYMKDLYEHAPAYDVFAF